MEPQKEEAKKMSQKQKKVMLLVHRREIYGYLHKQQKKKNRRFKLS